MSERSKAMLENMSGFVGYAMHDDLLLRAKRDVRAAEAARALKRQATRRQSCREAVAQALVELAMRISPTRAIDLETRALAR